MLPGANRKNLQMRFVNEIVIGKFVVTVLGCGAIISSAAFAQSDFATATAPPAPAPPAPTPESNALIALPIAEQPTPVVSPSDLPVAVPLSSNCRPAPQYAGHRACRPSERRCRIGDPNAPLNAMSRATPPGAALHSIMTTQIANGDAAQLALYEFDFYPGEARLNCRGMLRLMRIAREMSRLPFPLLIQPTLIDPGLDDARRAAVVNDLLTFEPSLSPDRVLVGLPLARPLDGLDAVLIHEKVLNLSTGDVPAAASAGPSAAIVLPPAQ